MATMDKLEKDNIKENGNITSRKVVNNKDRKQKLACVARTVDVRHL